MISLHKQFANTNNFMFPQINNTQENQVALHIALVNAIAETTDIVADSTNPFHKNKYASLSAHLDVLKPIFNKHGLAILQFPIGDADSVGVKTIIIHKDGASLHASALVPAEKGMSGQQAGALISYLRRYSLASVAGVATEDDDAETDRTAKTSAPKYVDIKTPKANTKFVPNPNATPAPTTAPAGDILAPFGDAKGTPLSQLPLKSNDRTKKCADLNYWANAWTPKPFGDSGVISKRDLATKAEAVRLYDIATKGNATDSPASVPETSDEIPF